MYGTTSTVAGDYDSQIHPGSRPGCGTVSCFTCTDTGRSPVSIENFFLFPESKYYQLRFYHTEVILKMYSYLKAPVAHKFK